MPPLPPLHRAIPAKANYILHLILIALLLIVFRVWHLSVMQYEQRSVESQGIKRKTIIEPAIRSTIRDRFNLPLAVNKITYQATIVYSQLQDPLPPLHTTRSPTPLPSKNARRRAYIQRLAHFLSSHLPLNADRIEDLIYAKASYYAQIPFVLSDDLSESQYYRLKMAEREWPGLHVRCTPQRHYPRGRAAADIIGYMGAINRSEYEKVLHQIKALKQVLLAAQDTNTCSPSLAPTRCRLKELEAKAYAVQDYVGKMGIEGAYEEQLRGFYGKKVFYTDYKGTFLRELSDSRPALPGQRLLLTLSIELQEYAEQLLTQNEALRVVRLSRLGTTKHTVVADKHPWMKGGSIVALDPHTGDVLALASYPRFDPNDFILTGSRSQLQEKRRRIHRWFETETHISHIWHQQVPLERERYDERRGGFYDESRTLTWPLYLELILSPTSPLRPALQKFNTLKEAISLCRYIEQLRTLLPECDLYSLFNILYLPEGGDPHRDCLTLEEKETMRQTFAVYEKIVGQIKRALSPVFSSLTHSYDKVLLVDLCRLAVDESRFSPELLERVGEETLTEYHAQQGSLVTLLPVIREIAQHLFHLHDFQSWREREGKLFLKQKRIEESQQHRYAKPYLDYFDRQEELLFLEFWNLHSWDFLLLFTTGHSTSSLLDNPALKPYYDACLSAFQHLQTSPSQALPWCHAYRCLQKVLSPLPPPLAIQYLKSMRSFDTLNRPLLGRYRSLRTSAQPLEKHLAAAFYPSYGFGSGRSYAYRQAAIQGSLFKIVTAYAALVQRFQQMGGRLLSPRDLNPFILIDEVYQQRGNYYVGYFEDGTPIPQLYKGGRLPRSLAHQHNGRVDLIKALEVSSNPYFSLLAGECLNSPDDLSTAARLFSYGEKTGIELPAEIAGKVPTDLARNRTGLYAMAIGQHSLTVTPLQTAIMLATIANGGKVLKPRLVKAIAGCSLDLGPSHVSPTRVYVPSVEIKRTIFMPEVVRQMILKGMHAATQRSYQDNLSALTRLYQPYPEAIHQLTALKDQLLGKTSTSESVETIDLDLNEGTNLYTHVWFGSLSFTPHDPDQQRVAVLLKDPYGIPEIVVVVYLRYGGYGKEAAPLAAQMVKKWREIKEMHGERL